MIEESNALLLAVDGGGSKTNVLITHSDGRIIGLGQAGASNYHGVGLDGAAAAFTQAIDAARRQAGLEEQSFALSFFGLAGVDRPEDKELIGAVIRKLPWPMGECYIDNDAAIALAAATLGQPGVVVICGTGSIMLGMNARGKRKRVGGWGALLGDEGSGYDLGLQALRAVARAADGRGAATLLSEFVLDALGLQEAQQLISYVYQRPMARNEIAAMARCVFQAAERGDAVALQLIEAAADELSLGAFTVLRDLEMTEGAERIGLSGGAFHSTILEHSFKQRILAVQPAAQIARSQHQPVIGAALLCLQHYHGGLSEAHLAKLLSSEGLCLSI